MLWHLPSTLHEENVTYCRVPLNSPFVYEKFSRLSSSTNNPTAIMPQIPAVPCVPIQLTGSSIFSFSIKSALRQAVAAPMKPIKKPSHGRATAQIAVIPTKPPSIPEMIHQEVVNLPGLLRTYQIVWIVTSTSSVLEVGTGGKGNAKSGKRLKC